MTWLRPALALAALLTAVPASAQTVTVLPPLLDEGLDEGVADLVAGYVADVLVAEGVELIPAAEGESCQDPACAAEARGRVGADFAAVVLVWARGAPGQVSGANIILAADPEHAYLGWRNVEAGGLQGGLAAAAGESLAALRRGHGPWLTVSGTPAGARVNVDGSAVGQLPYHGRITGGAHVIGVTAAGYEPEHLQVTVQSSPDAERVIEVQLQPSAASAAPPAPVAAPALALDAGAATGLNTATGVLLGATAVALVVLGAVQLTADGECDQEDALGRCSQVVDAPGGVALVASGAGAALLSGALFVWRPLEF